MFQESPESLFYMANDTVRQEVEAALQESHPSDVHPRISQELKGPSMYFDIMSLADARRYLMQILKNSDLKYYEDADVDTMGSYLVTNAVNILRCFTRYSSLLKEEMTKKHSAQERINLMAERVKFSTLQTEVLVSPETAVRVVVYRLPCLDVIRLLLIQQKT